MNQEQGPQGRGTHSRLSRLPMPRASHDNLRLGRTAAVPSSQSDSLSKSTRIPPKSRIDSSRIAPPVPLIENANKSIKSRYGLADLPVRSKSQSPVRDALRDVHTATLETTPPAFHDNAPDYHDGNENSGIPTKLDKTANGETKQKRRPRPSLSERTMETLSQISPSPSPTRHRRSSIFGNDGDMGPPNRPASSMRNSRPNTSSSVRSEASVKKTFRPPGRSSPTKEMRNLPPVPSPGSIHTPPRTVVRGRDSHVARTPTTGRKSLSGLTHDSIQEPMPILPSQYRSQTMRAKASATTKTLTTKKSAGSLSNVFKASAAPPLPKGKLAVASPESSSSLMRPKPKGENALASSSPRTGKIATKGSAAVIVDSTVNTSSPKSSASLRDTIAKAKAAKRAAENNKTLSAGNSETAMWTADSIPGSSTPSLGSNKGLLRKRIDGALSTGHLNIAAMDFEEVPDEVMKMYEPGNSSVPWSEMVDLTKINAADNKLSHLGDDMFPDWTLSEVAEDDSKTNQFGGLESLDLHNNMLHSLTAGLRRLERLTILNLNGNKLNNKALDIVRQIPNLRDLHFANNTLTGSISFETFASDNLRIIDLHNNQIEDISLDTASMTKLQKLDVSNNRIDHLPWEVLSQLPIIEINAANNKLSGLLIRHALSFKDLRTLDISHNSIEMISTERVDFSSLETLNVSANRITELPDTSELENIITLLASNNQLKAVPAGFDALKSVRNVDFSQNSIKVLDPAICRMDSLTALNLAGNPLRDRKYLTMDISAIKADLRNRFEPADDDEEHIVDNGKDHNTLTTLQQNSDITGYKYKPVNGILDLSSQNLKEIDLSAIDLTSSSQRIHTITLSNNDLTSLPINLLTHPSIATTLQTLNISHNPRLDSTNYLTTSLHLPSLKSLYIVSTGLTSLSSLTTHLQAPCLKELNISCHRLTGPVPSTHISFPALTTLLATDNWFSSISLDAARGLEVLDIRNNEIESLPPKLGLLGNFPSRNKSEPGRLRVFECSGNRFRVPRTAVIEKGSEAVLRDLRRMVPAEDVPDEWRDEL